MDEFAASYARCRQLARQAASNFYFSFRMLEREKRDSMCALYAFLRRTDDIGDSSEPVENRRQALTAWRESFRRALDHEFDDEILPALADTITRYQIPHQYLIDVIDGVEMDVRGCQYETFDELREYCYRVASVVGLACIHIWGFHGDGACEPARKCGLAFQMTNILRDLKEDVAGGRVYLPREELRRFDVSVDDLRGGVCSPQFRDLMRFQIERTERLYDEAGELGQWLEPDGRKMLGTMIATYRRLLQEIKRRDGDVFTRQVRLSAWQKLRIATRWILFPPRRTVSRVKPAARQPLESA